MNRMMNQRGKALEAMFFHKHDQTLIEQHERLEHIRRTRKALTEVSGIENPRILDKLMELEVSPAILASLSVIPLVEVAWADGKVQEKERKAILAATEESGFKGKSVDNALLEAWLKRRPPKNMLSAWKHYISGLCEKLNEAERNSLKSELLARAHAVAEASGGILGFGLKISAQEQDMLDTMAEAFASSCSIEL
jgi:hypothetical protein